MKRRKSCFLNCSNGVTCISLLSLVYDLDQMVASSRLSVVRKLVLMRLYQQFGGTYENLKINVFFDGSRPKNDWHFDDIVAISFC